ncbi:MAG: HesA/MoeB/ThiF family protein [Muribaculaceae bacterium]|nr:HesA/MoeB/ThiF family protein [Muribaculaceae bacterium]
MDRYVRNLALKGWDSNTQASLKDASVAVVGCGALGSVVAIYLAAAGIGQLRIADFDKVALHNLQRQVFFSEHEVGLSKAERLAKRIRALNSETNVEIFSDSITNSNICHFLNNMTIVAECSDNRATKEIVVSAGRKAAMPVVVGGVKEYNGQVIVFRTGGMEYSDIFPVSTQQEPTPSSLGVFSPVPGIVGSIQATEILKIITHLPGSDSDRLISFDSLSSSFSSFTI